ncbi:hypothetical protein OG21DRAFT_1526486 [Imleria badia]|nr:hypothetical protein OG21DRAFT_1526486 [Imleria badia]
MAATLPIPVYTNLEEVYQNLGTSLKHAEFKAKFGRPGLLVYRARQDASSVPPQQYRSYSFQGEHIDYSLFGVFPAAIEHDILIACAPRMPANVNNYTPGDVAENLQRKFPRQVCAPTRKPSVGPLPKEADVPADAVYIDGWHLDIQTAPLGWEVYVKVGYYGCCRVQRWSSRPHWRSAVNGILEDPSIAPIKCTLVEMAVENEKRFGMCSSFISIYFMFISNNTIKGMDQAASVISLAGSALYVSFFPKLKLARRIGQIYMPNTSTTYVSPNRSVPHACLRFALASIKRANQTERCHGEMSWRDVMGEPQDQTEEDVGKVREGLERMVQAVECLLPDGTGDGDQLGVTLKTMIEWSGTSVFEALGKLMNEFQESCSKLYECSCPEVDELTQLALRAGAYGSRVTGAGWGGCTVSLVDEAQVDTFIAKIKASYGSYRDLEGEAPQEGIFYAETKGWCV